MWSLAPVLSSWKPWQFGFKGNIETSGTVYDIREVLLLFSSVESVFINTLMIAFPGERIDTGSNWRMGESVTHG